jgi:hypothetical protein
LKFSSFEVREASRKFCAGLGFLLILGVFSSCGNSYTAKGHVKDFVSEKMALEDVDYVAWSDVDSTLHLTDSMLEAMHKRAETSRLVKGKVNYQPRTAKLNMITLKYAVKKDTSMATFYLDDKFAGIVGVKASAAMR